MTHDDYSELRGDIDEIKSDLKALREKLDGVLITGTPTLTRQFAELQAQVKDHEARVRVLETFAPFIKAAMALAGIIGASVIALIWALIVGQAQVVFP